MKVALHNLMSEATVDTTEYIPISELETPPILTLCARQAVADKNEEEFILTVDKFQYWNEFEMLKGIVKYSIEILLLFAHIA